jgi:hypothetical protein
MRPRLQEAQKTHRVPDIRQEASEGGKTTDFLFDFSYISAAPVMSLLCSHVSVPSCPHCGIKLEVTFSL